MLLFPLLLVPRTNVIVAPMNSQRNFSAVTVLAVLAVVSCRGYVQPSKSSIGLDHRGLNVRGGQTKLAAASDIPELRAPKSMYANVVELGALKAGLSPVKTFILGILSGCHIAFGKSSKLTRNICNRSET